MCGIAGCINSVITETDLDLIGHRGPDSKNIVNIQTPTDRIVFGHTRLAILELTDAGAQPMESDCGNFLITYNGELYNHLELRKKLNGIRFRGESDTETILYYIREFGIESVKDFLGIFAFALVDKLANKTYLVRDQIGVKPLYYYHKGHQLIFSSEIKIIKNHPLYEQELNLEALNTFLSFRYNPSPQSLFKNVQKLEPATYLTFQQGRVTFCQYWKKKQNIDQRISEKEAIFEYKSLLEKAVTRQLQSDVPIGLLLSGGLDSAVLGHLITKSSAKPLKTYTVGFEGKGNFNELEDAQQTADFINSEHQTVLLSQPQYLNNFYNSFDSIEEPIAEPTIPALLAVSQLASNDVKVVLSGQGADEPMAGYKRYLGEKFASRYYKLLRYLPTSLLARAFSNNSLIDRGLYSIQFKEELKRFIGIFTLFTPELKQKLFSDQFQNWILQDQEQLFSSHYNQTEPTSDSLSKLLFLDTRTMLPDNLLLFNDKATMAFSLENRVPYLDLDLINFLEQIPINMKLRGFTGKYIHRKAAESWLPRAIIHRKKRGFETPINDWLKAELGGTLVDLIEDANSLSKKYFRLDFIRHMIRQHTDNKKDYRTQLFIILSLETWYSMFFLKKQL